MLNPILILFHWESQQHNPAVLSLLDPLIHMDRWITRCYYGPFVGKDSHHVSRPVTVVLAGVGL